jgi:hypothetical protein
VWFVVDTVAVGQGFIPALRYFFFSIIPPMLHTATGQLHRFRALISTPALFHVVFREASDTFA